MQVKNIECQLAQGQLNRYLGGGALSDTALSQLEAHIRECEDCAEHFEDRKQSLQQSLQESPDETGMETAPAPPEPNPSNAGVPRFLVDALRRKKVELDVAVRPVVKTAIPTHAVIEVSEPELPSRASFLRPLLYSLGLAAVLIGMSTIMRDPTKLFGERVDTAVPVTAGSASSETVSEPAATPVQSPDEKPVASASKPEAEPGGSSATNVPATDPTLSIAPAKTNPAPAVQPDSPALQPKPANPGRREAGNRQTSRRRSQRPAAHTPAPTGIRVYPADNP